MSHALYKAVANSRLIDGLKRFFPRVFKRKFKRISLNLYDSPRYYTQDRASTIGGFLHFVFICKGNICRSAFADHYFRSIVDDPAAVIVESCGLDVDQGHRSPESAVQAAAQLGVSLEDHRSKGLSECNLNKSDLIVLMEYSQFLKFNNLYPHFKKKTILLREFLPWPRKMFCNLYDPYGLNDIEFKRCFKTMKAALDRMGKDFDLKQS
jgi:protein-tyrosine phosphatase